MSGGGGLHHDDGWDEQTHRHASSSFGHVVSSSSGGSGRLAFPKRNPSGDGAGSSAFMVRAWSRDSPQIGLLQRYEALNDDYRELYESYRSCGDVCLHVRAWSRGISNLAFVTGGDEALNDDYRELYESYRSCGDVSDRLTETRNQLVDVIRNRNQLADENKTLRQEHLGHLEEALASKTSSLSEAESVAGTLNGDLDCLTLDLSHAEIVRHNYVRHLLPTVFQWLLSNDEYKKSLSDVFNQAIAAGWSEGVKVERSMEDAEEILSAATDYDPECKATFMSALMLFLPRATHMWRSSLSEGLLQSFAVM
ncbi:hypothetical protein Tco_0418194 [Tanacetum coccineum]